MRVIDLCGQWDAECLFDANNKFDFAGNVPGSAINDLINAKKLPENIFWRDHADAVLDYEKCNYVYKKTFDFHGERKKIILHFERIDTYADIFLNGKKLYHSENGNICHDIDITDTVLQGSNLVEVHLYSASEWVKDMPLRKGAFTRERMNTRRMQCTYGWDWVGRFLTCGLGECKINTLDDFEVLPENVYVVTTEADNESATVSADISFPFDYEGRVLEFLILAPDGSVSCRTLKYCKEDFVRLDFSISAPQLWYPLGYGEQPLYTLVIKDGDDLVYSEKIGLRTVKIMQRIDPAGSKNHELCLSIKNPKYDFNETFSEFVLKINGEKVFCRGANWVPCVPFGIGNIDSRQTELLELCAEAGVNMLRVWGGGAFESRHFYNECSRLGIMVTQDFLMACGAYPEDEDWFIEELKKETLYAARLCRNQPCLVWWSGDNENAVDGCDTDANYKGRRSAYEGIAPILYREDPYRRFLPSSPYGGNRYASNTVGTTHNTQFLGQLFPFLLGEDLSDYKDEFKKYRARFIAEEPQLGAISLPSLRRFMNENDIFNDDAMWRYHIKDNPGLKFTLFDCLSNVAEKILGTFTTPADKLFKLQYVQYEWVRVTLEQARRNAFFCSGIIYWMMNECWPAASGWALIDYYNLPKNAFYAFKRCSRSLIASVDCDDGVYRLYVINDGERKTVEADIKILSADRKTVKEYAKIDACAEKASSSVVFEAEHLLADKDVLICDVKSAQGNDRAFYCKGALEICPAEIDVAHDKKKGLITVTAKEKYVHSVVFSGNLIFDDNCFSLLPNESRAIFYRRLDASVDECLSVEAYTLV
jgi:beta-mannosidase